MKTLLIAILIFLSTSVRADAHQDIADKIKNTAVSIMSIRGKTLTPRYHISGSGFIIDRHKGYVMTNAHVLPESRKRKLKDKAVYVRLNDGRIIATERALYFYNRDIAILKLKEGFNLTLPLKKDFEAKFTASQHVKIGEIIFTYGNPNGLRGVFTVGNISGSGFHSDMPAPQLYENMFIVSAVINRGNSGGAVYDLRGRVIGMITLQHSRNGLGYAIPSGILESVYEIFRNGDQPNIPFVGVEIRDAVAEDAKTHGVKKLYTQFSGVVVTKVYASSPADVAGLQKGDFIYSIMRHSFSKSQTARAILQEYAGGVVWLDVLRKGKKLSLKVRPKNVFEDLRKQDVEVVDPQVDAIMAEPDDKKQKALIKAYTYDKIELKSKKSTKNGFVKLYRRVLMRLKNLL